MLNAISPEMTRDLIGIMFWSAFWAVSIVLLFRWIFSAWLSAALGCVRETREYLNSVQSLNAERAMQERQDDDMCGLLRGPYRKFDGRD